MKKRKVIVNKSNSYKEVKEFQIKYEISLTPEERLDTLQYLREQFYKIRNIKPKKMDKSKVTFIKKN